MRMEYHRQHFPLLFCAIVVPIITIGTPSSHLTSELEMPRVRALLVFGRLLGECMKHPDADMQELTCVLRPVVIDAPWFSSGTGSGEQAARNSRSLPLVGPNLASKRQHVTHLPSSNTL